MKNLRLLWLCSLSITCGQTAFSQPAIVVTQITSVPEPVDITGAGDASNRLFIVDKDGKIRIYNLTINTLLTDNFLDINTQVLNSGERGLLGLTFHPNYEVNGYFYVNYVHTGGNTRISRFTNSTPASNGPVVVSTELILLDIPQPFDNHKGGDLTFGPDGYLYIALGDGGSGGDPGNRAQNPAELLGKMLRIDVDNTSSGLNYAIPPTNPFYNSTTARKEIWALGLRNPWRFSFDRLTGDMWIADVGQNAWEEVDFQPAGSPGGANYGWRCYEGNHAYNTAGCGPMSSYAGPVFEYDHSFTNGGLSITGGFVYRGTDAPALQGWYVVADFISDNFWLVKSDGTFQLQPSVPVITNVVTFGEDDNGELYVSNYDGPIYKITSNPLPIELLTFTGSYRDGRTRLVWNTATEKNGDYFQIERQTAGGDFLAIGRVEAVGESLQQQHYTFDDLQPVPGENVYRLRMVDRDSRFEHSPSIIVTRQETAGWQLAPNPATGQVTLSINGQDEPPMFRFEVYNAQGRLVLAHEQVAPALPYRRDFQIASLPRGIYFCRLEVDGKADVRRLVVE